MFKIAATKIVPVEYEDPGPNGHCERKFSDDTNSICTLFNCGNGMFEGDKYNPFYIHPETKVNIDNKMKKFNNTLLCNEPSTPKIMREFIQQSYLPAIV